MNCCIRLNAVAGFLAVAVFPTLAACAAQTSPYQQVIQPFLSEYCIDCHGPDKEKGDLRLDTLGTDFRNACS